MDAETRRVVVRNLFDITKLHELHWEPFRPGIDIVKLYGDPASHTGAAAAALLRYAPGAGVPMHQHSGREHIIILAGAQADEHGVESAGTLVVNQRGSRHTVTIADGCIALVIWDGSVRFDSTS